MKTASIVSLIKREASSWSRELILDVVDVVHSMLVENPVAQQRITTTTGGDPYLITIDGTYEYEATSTNLSGTQNAWMVDKVYTGNLDDTFQEVPVITKYGTYSNSALIIFADNPGTTTTTYKVKCFKSAQKITSENIQLGIPERFHLSHLYEGVMGWIEKTDSGKSERWDFFEKKLIPEYKWIMNRNVRQNTIPRYDGGY
jgi:hypothetical protein